MTEAKTKRMPCTRAFPHREEQRRARAAKSGSSKRARLVLYAGVRWLNGTVLRYRFLSKPEDVEESNWLDNDTQLDIIRRGFDTWNNLIGVQFKEDNSPQAEIKVGFLTDDSDETSGSWSYIGTDILTAWKDDKYGRTMNIGWRLEWIKDDEFEDGKGADETIVHEIGHTLGFPHEHQNPKAGITWNKSKVIASLRGPPNYWPLPTIYSNILDKIPASEIEDGSEWDPKSIMHYPFEAGLIKAPAKYKSGIFPPGRISDLDRKMAAKWYPRLTREAKFQRLEEGSLKSIPTSEDVSQHDFKFTPSKSANYSFRLLGDVDAVIVLFDSEGLKIRADDGTGVDREPAVVANLKGGQDYKVSVRVLESTEHIYLAALPLTKPAKKAKTEDGDAVSDEEETAKKKEPKKRKGSQKNGSSKKSTRSSSES